MSRADFFSYLLSVHGAIACAEPGGMVVYRQHHIRDIVAGTSGDSGYLVAPDRDGVSEIVFDDLPGLFADLRRPYTREKIGPDGVNFSDLPTASAFVGAISDVSVPRPGNGRAKVIAFVSARPGLGLDQFGVDWAAARESVEDGTLEPIRSLSIQQRLTEGDKVVGYFGGADAHSYQGMLSLSFDDQAMALEHAGRYLDALGDVIDPARCWRALVDEVVIYRR